MPALSESLLSSLNIDPSSLTPAEQINPPASVDTTQPSLFNGFQRCPLPPIFASNPDSLRNFYVSGKVPQYRIYAQSVVK